MEDIAVADIRSASSDQASARRAVRSAAILKRCSHVDGRDRWHINTLENSPRLAAAVELVLRTEAGITEVRTNPLTGRLLVRYAPELLTESVETLIERALSFGPMSREEFSVPRQSTSFPAGSVVAAELSCSVFQMIVLGGVCPLGLVAAALFFLLKRVSPAGRCPHPT